MVRIKPFNGLRYNKEKVKYSDVVTQPYDKISAELLDEYYKRSEYTTAKLIRNKAADPYTDAAKNLTDWKNENILIKDEKPCIYAYHQQYTIDGVTKVRKGFVAAVGLEEISAKVILPHERTLSKPKADRLNLLRATHTHFGQIFFLYKDHKKVVNNILAEVTTQAPDEVAVDHFGDTHTLWKVEDTAVIAKISEFFKDKQLLIADGHHRYETSCNFARENQQMGGEGLYSYTMGTLINMEDDGLTVLPTHRLLHGLENFSAEAFISSAEKYFQITVAPDLHSTLTEMAKQANKNTFGFYAGKQFYVLTFKSASVMDEFIGQEHPQEWKTLDLAVLHTVILEKLFGISKEKQASQDNLNYVRSVQSAVDRVNTGSEQCLFLVNYTPVAAVEAVAQAGDVMPQKSTDFYPKLLSGMVMYTMR